MNNTVTNKLQLVLNKRKEQNSFRALSYVKAPIDFCSNDYLGLAQSQILQSKIKDELKESDPKNGATGSRLISGNSREIVALENSLARLFKGEKALLYNSGYNANVGVLSCIPKRGDVVFYDELSHASIKDGIRLSMAQKMMFRHNDLNDLEQKLKKVSAGNKFIVVESIYSMDGDSCPLNQIVELSKKYHAEIILDEAHSTGVIGGDGAGMAVDLNVQQLVFARIYTFGKAMGVHGACVVGNETLVKYLMNFSRSFIYTTALPMHSVISIKAAFSLLKQNDNWQRELEEVIHDFIKFFSEIFDKTLERTNSNSAIQGVIIAGNDNVKKIAGYMNEKGYDVRPILSPTVKEGEERIRICLHRYNTKGQIEGMLNALKEAIA